MKNENENETDTDAAADGPAASAAIPGFATFPFLVPTLGHRCLRWAEPIPVWRRVRQRSDCTEQDSNAQETYRGHRTAGEASLALLFGNGTLRRAHTIGAIINRTSCP